MDPNIFVYSINWVEFVFCSRSIAEELLLPERETGNLTASDYDKAINFLPHAKYYSYRPIGGVVLFSLASLLGIRYRRPKWTTPQKAGIIACLGFTGYTLGKFNIVKAHAQFLRSIENPRGFSDAMRSIESRTGLQSHLTRGLKFTTILSDKSREDVLYEKPTDSVPPISPLTSRKALSRWDEIRMANSNASHPSSWDILRQKHAREGESSQSKLEPRSSPGTTFSRDPQPDPTENPDSNFK